MEWGVFSSGLQVPGPRPGSLCRRVAEVQFADADGVEVLVALNVDQDGELFELDVWKTDFGPLIRIPNGTMK